MPHKIFIAEDDPGIRRELTALLERYGYLCEAPQEFSRTAEQTLASGAHLVLLDLNLPRPGRPTDLPGAAAAVRFAHHRGHQPGHRAGRADEHRPGADDFLAKPYSAQILLARIARLLQRAYPSGPAPALTCGALSLDLGRGTAALNGQEVQLTRNEARILQRAHG